MLSLTGCQLSGVERAVFCIMVLTTAKLAGEPQGAVGVPQGVVGVSQGVASVSQDAAGVLQDVAGV